VDLSLFVAQDTDDRQHLVEDDRVAQLQAQEVATVQLAPLEVGLRFVVIQVKEDAHLHAFVVLQKTMNMVTETQVITIIK